MSFLDKTKSFIFRHRHYKMVITREEAVLNLTGGFIVGWSELKFRGSSSPSGILFQGIQFLVSNN